MFNVNTIYYQLLAAMTTAIGDDWEKVKGTAEGFLESKKDRIADLIKSGLDDSPETGVSKDFVVNRLKDELQILESELLSMQVIATSIAQEAINKVVETVMNIIDGLTKPKTEA